MILKLTVFQCIFTFGICKHCCLEYSQFRYRLYSKCQCLQTPNVNTHWNTVDCIYWLYFLTAISISISNTVWDYFKSCFPYLVTEWLWLNCAGRKVRPLSHILMEWIFQPTLLKAVAKCQNEVPLGKYDTFFIGLTLEAVFTPWYLACS